MSNQLTKMPLLLLVAVALSQLVVSLDYLSMSVALPVMSVELQVPTTTLQWALSAYLLSFASFMIVGGRLGDIYGRRRALIGGIVIFAIASILGGVSTSVSMLIAARILQGVGAAFFFPISFSILTNALPEKQRQTATGIVVGIANLGLAIGPFVGGLLTGTLGWRWVFYFNVPVAIVAIILAMREMSESRDESVAKSIDWAGLVTIVSSCVVVSLLINYGADWGWTSMLTIGAVAASIILFWLCGRIEHRVSNPLIQPELFAGRAFSGITLTGSVGNILFCLAVFAFTLFFENVRGFPPLLAGASLLPLSAGTAIAGPVAGRLDAKFGPRVPMISGLLCSLVSFTVIGVNALAGSWLLLLSMLGIAGLGLGLVYATTDTAALAVVPPQKAGAASGIALTGLVLAGSFGVTATAELIEAFGGEPVVTLQSISSTTLVGATIAVVTIFLGLALLPGRSSLRRTKRK